MYLKDYNDYMIDLLFENVRVNSLPFVITDRLKNVLSNINHPIAEEIIKISSDREEKGMTFIDLDTNEYSPNDDNDVIFKRFTFLNAQKAYDNISKQHNIGLERIINTTKTTISFDSNVLNSEWFKKSRSAIRVGAFVKKLFGDKFKEAGDQGNDITSFVNMVYSKRKTMEDGHGGFQLVSGDDIVFWYNEENYLKDGGPLNGSCMRYDRCSSYIKFYAKCKNVQLLILKDAENNDLIVGRAIIWKLHRPEDRYFMDRIYYTSDKFIELFKDYATEQGWLYKNNQNMSANEYIIDSKDGSKQTRTLVALCNGSSSYPYMDTMKYFDYDNGVITNDSDYLDDVDEYYELESTGGDYEEISRGIYVEFYDDRFNEDELQWCEYGEEYRLHVDAIELGRSFGYRYATQDYIDDNLVWSDYHDDYIGNDEAIWVDDKDDYYLEDDLIEQYKSADYETFEDAIEDDKNKEVVVEEDTYYITYFKNAKIYYFSEFGNKDYFISDVMTNDGLQYKHKVWDKDNLIQKDGKYYYYTNQKDHDKLVGQLRLFDNKNNKINKKLIF